MKKLKKKCQNEEIPMPSLLTVHPSRQDTLTLTYSKLDQIPQPLANTLIRHLFLSHNNLTSLKGIEKFTELESLNVSHNHLTSIQQLQWLPNPHLLERIGLRRNQFRFGYENYVVQLFQNLQKLDDLSISFDRQYLKSQANFIRDHYVKACQIGLRLIDFMTDMLQKIKMHTQLSIQGQYSLLYENLPEAIAIKLHSLYAKNHSQTQKMTFVQNASLQQQTISLLLKSDIKCTCRPINLRQELYNTFSFIFDRILLHYQDKFDKTFAKALPNKNIYEFYKMQPSLSKMQKHPGKYIQKVNLIHYEDIGMDMLPVGELRPWTKQVMLSRIQQKPESQIQDQYLEHLPVFYCTASYCRVLSDILLGVVFKIVNLHDQILSNRHRVSNKQNMPLQQSNTDNLPTVNAKIRYTIADSLRELKANHAESVAAVTEKKNILEVSPFEEPPTLKDYNCAQMDREQYVTVEKIHQISLMYKVLRGLMMNNRRRTLVK